MTKAQLAADAQAELVSQQGSHQYVARADLIYAGHHVLLDWNHLAITHRIDAD